LWFSEADTPLEVTKGQIHDGSLSQNDLHDV